MIGLIIPPADIKKLLDKTAEHVAINGSDFQTILMQREQHKPEFAFLLPASPYRPYYDHRVAAISKQMLQGLQAEEVKQHPVEPQLAIEEEPAPQQETLLNKIFVELKEPPPDKYGTEWPQRLGQGEQAIIQHTAQYAARNGKNFLVALSEREKNNPQFQFLRTSSRNHSYFITLVQAYLNVLQMPQQQLQLLLNYSKGSERVLEKCRDIFEFHSARQQKARGRKEQPKQAKQSNIDWNDFQLVETISFDYEQGRGVGGGELLARIQKNAALAPKAVEETIISQPKSRQILQQCHICRQNILVSQMNKHLKTCLGQKAKNNSSQAVRGEEVDVGKHLGEMSLHRQDIFGQRGQGIQGGGEKEHAEQRISFNGQAANINRSTGSLAMLLLQQQKLKQEVDKGK